MTFIDLLKRIRGLHCKYNNGMCRVMEVYWETERAMIHLDAGVEYTMVDEYAPMTLTFISDGHDKIIVPLDELIRFNSK